MNTTCPKCGEPVPLKKMCIACGADLMLLVETAIAEEHRKEQERLRIQANKEIDDMIAKIQSFPALSKFNIDEARELYNSNSQINSANGDSYHNSQLQNEIASFLSKITTCEKQVEEDKAKREAKAKVFQAKAVKNKNKIIRAAICIPLTFLFHHIIFQAINEFQNGAIKTIFLGDIIFVAILGLLMSVYMDEPEEIGWRIFAGIIGGAFLGAIVGLVNWFFAGLPNFISVVWWIAFIIVDLVVIFVPNMDD